MHHPKSDVIRLYLPHKKGGRELVQLGTIPKNINYWNRHLFKQHK